MIKLDYSREILYRNVDFIFQGKSISFLKWRAENSMYMVEE